MVSDCLQPLPFLLHLLLALLSPAPNHSSESPALLLRLLQQSIICYGSSISDYPKRWAIDETVPGEERKKKCRLVKYEINLLCLWQFAPAPPRKAPGPFTNQRKERMLWSKDEVHGAMRWHHNRNFILLSAACRKGRFFGAFLFSSSPEATNFPPIFLFFLYGNYWTMTVYLTI